MSEESANGVVRVSGASGRARENGSAPEKRTSVSGRVLLLDVDVPFRESLVAALHRFEIEVSWRARILGLFDAIAEADPIALVMSAHLPGSDPLELIRAVRRSRWTELPILVIVDRPDRHFELRAYVDGADSVLERTGCASELAAHIIGLATRRRRRRKVEGRDLADAALELARAGRTADLDVPPTAHDTTRGPVETRAGLVPDRNHGAWSASYPEPTPGVEAGGPPGHASHTSADRCPACAPRMGGATNGPPDAPPSLPLSRSDVAPGLAEAAVPDVILVDDDPSLLEMLRYALTNRGHRTLSLSNGLDALRALRDLDTGGRRPVVLLDVDLPGLDGFRILHELGGCRPGDYQVILCTIHSSEATQVLGIQSGAVDYIVKPFRMPVVLAKVERLLDPDRVAAGV